VGRAQLPGAQLHARPDAVGDGVFFYHSNCAEPGIAGIVEVCELAYPDRTQFDPKSTSTSTRSRPDNPRWLNVDVRIVKKTPLVGLDELRAHPNWPTCACCKGNRLSITPVDPAEWKFITES
jgi:predicted RNA-binding protein with PUA-like domain